MRSDGDVQMEFSLLLEPDERGYFQFTLSHEILSANIHFLINLFMRTDWMKQTVNWKDKRSIELEISSPWIFTNNFLERIAKNRPKNSHATEHAKNETSLFLKNQEQSFDWHSPIQIWTSFYFFLVEMLQFCIESNSIECSS